MRQGLIRIALFNTHAASHAEDVILIQFIVCPHTLSSVSFSSQLGHISGDTLTLRNVIGCDFIICESHQHAWESHLPVFISL